jgi:hypothetical protein
MNDSTAIYDPVAKCALLTFRGFLTTPQFVEIAEQAHILRKQYNSNRQLNDIEDMKVLTQEIQKYLQDTWFPKAVQTGLQYFAFVVPKNVLAVMSMKGANKDADKTGIEIKYFDNLVEAKNWLKSK